MCWHGSHSSQTDSDGICDGHNAQRKLTFVHGNFFGHSIECVHISAATEQTFPEDKPEHDPNWWRKEGDDFRQEDCHIDELEHGHQPDFVNLHQIDWWSWNKHTDLVVNLKPTVLCAVIQPNVFEINQFKLKIKQLHFIEFAQTTDFIWRKLPILDWWSTRTNRPIQAAPCTWATMACNESCRQATYSILLRQQHFLRRMGIFWGRPVNLFWECCMDSAREPKRLHLQATEQLTWVTLYLQAKAL